MAENSKIEWTDHTFNPWRGCTKVSDGCKFCYAETLSGRNPGTLGIWGPKGTRVIAAESYWRQPLKWNREAKAEGVRRRVFCASLADVFEGPETMPKSEVVKVEYARARLLHLIESTPDLDWLLLTKRPENVIAQLEAAIAMFDPACYAPEWAEYPHLAASFLREWVKGNAPSNVWIGTSVEDQKTANARIPHLLQVPATVRFLSCEPLLGPVDLNAIQHPWYPDDPEATIHAFHDCEGVGGVDWVIVGGESGANARPMVLGWAKDLVRQCKAASVPVFVKQMGDNPTNREGERCPHIRTSKGKDMAEWPEELRVREFPEVQP